MDADPYGGSVAQVLGVLDEVSGLLAASRLAAGGTLAERFDSVARRLDDRLAVVTGLPRPDRWTEVRAGTVEALLDVARTRGDVVVDTGFGLAEGGLDLGRPGRDALTVEALGAADEVLVVGTADPVGLSRLARGLVDLREVMGPVPVRLVVNRMRSTLGWSEQDVASMVAGFGHPVSLHFLPDDRDAVDRALVTGRSLTESAPDSSLVRALAVLADAVVPGAGPATNAAPLDQAPKRSSSPPTVNAIIAKRSGSWPVSWCCFGSSRTARSCAAMTPTTCPRITASTLMLASRVGW